MNGWIIFFAVLFLLNDAPFLAFALIALGLMYS